MDTDDNEDGWIIISSYRYDKSAFYYRTNLGTTSVGLKN